MRMTTEPLLIYDRLRGPHGSGEWSGLERWFVQPEMHAGNLAESWEIIQPDTLKFKIRKGVRWHDKPPVNGAELTADDVLFSFVRVYEEKRENLYGRYYAPYLADPDKVTNSIYIDPDDPWTVVVKSKPGQLAYIWENTAGQIWIVPRAQIRAPGYKDRLPRWQDLVGTGPFMVKDHVRGTTLIFVRNLNYWKKDVFHPENQLPYIDEYRQVVVPDLSTQMAALRTGKIDFLMNLRLDDARSLRATNPELLSISHVGDELQMHMRVDKPPFNNLKVRQAMMMAIDHPSIVQDYYQGEATLFYWPAWPVPEHAGFYRPLEEMPEIVRQMYGYHPDIAAKMLDEAGYPGPNRFITSILVSAATPQYVDLLSIVAAQWAKIGVTLKIDVKEAAVYSAMKAAYTYQHGVDNTMRLLAAVKWNVTTSYHSHNYARLKEPWLDQGALDIIERYFNTAERDKYLREMTPRLQEFVPHLNLPLPNWYVFWQPWLKHYHGERYTSYVAANRWLEYVWIDHALRQKMTGRR